jgi:DNA-binding XRE family transcriptional regulator
MTRAAVSAKKRARVAPPEQPLSTRLVAAYLEPTADSLTCGFEGGEALTVSLTELGLQPGSPITWAEPDDLRAGVTFVREDGTLEDCGADYIRLVGRGAVAPSLRARHAGELGRRVGKRLRQIRKRLGLTQRAMSERLEMAPPNYSRLESGTHAPSVSTLMRISEALGVPFETLVKR